MDGEPEKKQCTKCGQWLPATAEYFNIADNKSGRLRGDCKECQHGRARQWREANREAIHRQGRQYREANRDIILERKRQHWRSNREGIAERRRQRYAANREAGRERSRQYYQANREARIEYQHEYYKENRSAVLERNRRWAEANKEAHSAYHQRYYQEHWVALKQYRQENRKQLNANNARRRARKLGNGGNHTAADITRQYKAQRGRCYWCGKKVGDNYHVDHVIPLARGGSNGPENIVIACPVCNLSKHDRLPHEWEGTDKLL